MKVVFMGTPDFALPSLRALLQSNHTVAAVVTQPDRPAGRGKKMRPPPVKTLARQAGLPVYQPEKIGETGFLNALHALDPEVIVVAAYGRILPKKILDLPPYGCINVHASLLPAYRGAAPIQWAVINGEKETGITIMQMDEGLDTGDILMQGRITIGEDDTAGTVHDLLASLGGQLLVQTLDKLARGQIRPVPQNHALASYAPPLTTAHAVINWANDAVAVKNQVRGLHPWPGARTYLGDKLLKIWRVSVPGRVPGNGGGPPGRVLAADGEKGLLVQTGRGIIKIEELQLQGKRQMPAALFLRGNPVLPGEVLGKHPDGG